MANWLPVTEPFGTSLKVMVILILRPVWRCFILTSKCVLCLEEQRMTSPGSFGVQIHRLGMRPLPYDHMQAFKSFRLEHQHRNCPNCLLWYFTGGFVRWNYMKLSWFKVVETQVQKKARWKNTHTHTHLAAESALFNSFSAGKDPGHHQSQRSSLLAHLFEP